MPDLVVVEYVPTPERRMFLNRAIDLLGVFSLLRHKLRIEQDFLGAVERFIWGDAGGPPFFSRDLSSIMRVGVDADSDE